MFSLLLITGQQGRADLEAVVVYVNTLGSLLRIQEDQARLLTCAVEPVQREEVRMLKLGDRIQLGAVLAPQKCVV